MPEGFQTDVDEEILKKVVGFAKREKIGELLENGELAPAFESLLRQFVHYATGEDQIWSEPRALLERALQAWTSSAVRKEGEHTIELRIKQGNDWREKRLVLDLTTEDKPFVVDSISAALAEAGKPVSFFANCVINAQRDTKGERCTDGKTITRRESMVHAEMDPPVDVKEIDVLRTELERVLDDVTIAVADWEPMRARLGTCIAQLEKSRPAGVKGEEQREAIAFLKWLWDNRFAFLGVRSFSYSKSGENVSFNHDVSRDLGILKDPERRILKATYDEAGDLSPAVEAFMESDEPIIVAKANSKSLTHRRAHMDYVGVKSYSVDGKVTGEERFVGLFTSEAYNRPATDIPLLRSKIQKVIENTAFTPGGHNEKALINILETYPRDEIFQVDVDTLRETSLGILRLFKRPRVKLFIRRDRFERFISALVFIPRDRFNSDGREQIGNLLASTFHGRVSTFSPFFGDAALVRVHFIIGLDKAAPEGPGLTDLTRAIRGICRHWSDDLLDAIQSAHGGAAPAGLFSKYENAFGAGYRERTSIDEALADIAALEDMSGKSFTLRVYRLDDDPPDQVRLKIYRAGKPLTLSKVIPTLENFGLNVIQESGFQVHPNQNGAAQALWIHDFLTSENRDRPVALEDIKRDLEEAVTAVLEGRTEDDGFNALVLTAGLNWREAWLMRAAAKHHLQAGFQFSQSYIEETLCNHPVIARSLAAVFHTRFNPAGPKDPARRTTDVNNAEEAVTQSLATVESLDEDRIIRRYLNLFSAIIRTSYYQLDENGAYKPYISFKIDSQKIDELPAPRPYREIFMSGPRVDGIHLRFGPIARGGLRWSDRREDFRTEVLGLVKAQRVKNAVIVPTGSKGGFYPKQIPHAGDRAAIYEAGREAYKEFIRSLLDLTDNIIDGKVIPPADIVLWDDADPYLVVAADKGTAQFSDTANAISGDYNFWLGDAFASGGSAGYDHKVMGITARGAWEAVKRHFREMGKDIQAEPFTVAGVGDMSGDVFGNGMLLSKQIKLIAAFDHRDIIIDPKPNPKKSYQERKRLFDLPRSSWQDYDKALISKGGGVFSRSAKSINLSPEIKTALDIKADKLTPSELIKMILKSPMELFWLGGIGTYYKAEAEENWRVGDRANDAVRINAEEMRFKVVGEGANLGLTQLARIAFARHGGRINTDAIDNSAGVDSSDHEVNIKILLSNAIERAELKPQDRNSLLASMTEEVAEHVLRHNYEQTRAITQLEATASGDIDAHSRFMITLENEGRLDRAVENLPDRSEIVTLKQSGLGLTRPDLAVLLAYSKMWLFDELVDSNAPDDPAFECELFDYFPDALHDFKRSVTSHRLRREIIATRLANEIVDTCGLSFAQRAVETTGASFAEVAIAYEAVRRIFYLGDFAQSIDGLDSRAPAKLQTGLYLQASYLLREQAFRLLNSPENRKALSEKGMEKFIDQYKAPVNEFKLSLPEILPSGAAAALDERCKEWITQGAPEDLAMAAASLPLLERALDIVDLASQTGWSNPGVGSVFFAVGRLFSIDALRDKARREPPDEHFDRIAVRQLIAEFADRQRTLAKRVIEFADTEPKGSPKDWVEKIVAAWSETGEETILHFNQFVGELDLAGRISVGKLTLLNKKLQELAHDS